MEVHTEELTFTLLETRERDTCVMVEATVIQDQ